VDEAALAIEARGLTKRYGPTLAIDDVDLDVPAGTVLGLLGPEGAGKTTMLRLIAGLRRPTRGDVTLGWTDDGARSTRHAGHMALRRRVGVVDQEPAFYDWMTGRELLAFVGGLLGLAGEELRSRVDAVLERQGLDADADRRIEGYGSALRKRLAVAQAIVGRPGLVLLDEPFVGLDPDGAAELRDLVVELGGRATVVVASSDPATARLCERIGVLDAGRLVAEGEPDDLLERVDPPGYVIEVDPGEEPGIALLVDALRRQAWVRDVNVEGQVLRVAVRHAGLAAMRLVPLLGTSGLPIRRVERRSPTLPDLLAALDPEQALEAPAGGAAAEAAR
jgi:ABC-2 type transport system ATP-binding protein